MNPPCRLTAERVRQVRRRLLQMHHTAHVGHLGGNLSALDVLLCLHHEVLTPDDHFVLSKGHAAGALYATLWSVGRLPEAQLATFHGEGTLLSGHPPPHGLPGVTFATGSLGHGLGLASGLALGLRLQGQPGQVYCLTSDGEWNEGSNWESLIFARQQQLARLTVIVDANGLQGFGTTREVADLEPLADKFRAFGWPVQECDGHDLDALRAALPTTTAGPRVVIARTHKGHGVSFMQDRLEWHYLPLSAPQYEQALQELADHA